MRMPGYAPERHLELVFFLFNIRFSCAGTAFYCRHRFTCVCVFIYVYIILYIYIITPTTHVNRKLKTLSTFKFRDVIAHFGAFWGVFKSLFYDTNRISCIKALKQALKVEFYPLRRNHGHLKPSNTTHKTQMERYLSYNKLRFRT